MDWQILVRDGPACLPRNLGGEVRKRIGVVAGELIRFAVMTCPDERDDGGLRVIGPCRARKLAVSRASNDGAPRERATDRGGMVLGVPTVPKNRVRNAGGLEFRLGLPVLDLCSTAKLIGETSAWRRLV